MELNECCLATREKPVVHPHNSQMLVHDITDRKNKECLMFNWLFMPYLTVYTISRVLMGTEFMRMYKPHVLPIFYQITRVQFLAYYIDLVIE